MAQVRKMKRKSCEYDYVEVMACPSGCLNGGGQLKAGNRQSQQQLLDQLDAIYHEPEVCASAQLCPLSSCRRLAVCTTLPTGAEGQHRLARARTMQSAAS